MKAIQLVVLGAALIGVPRTPVVAQNTIAPMTRVRVALPQGEMVEGRVVRGDSLSIVVQVESTGAQRTIDRGQILLLTTMRSGLETESFPMTVLAGLFGVAGSGALTAKCQSYTQYCGPSKPIAVAAGVITALVASLAFSNAEAQSSSAWTVLPSSIAVSGSAGSAMYSGDKECRRLPSVEARAGFSGAGSKTRSIAASLFCYKALSTGLETGVLRDFETGGVRYSGAYYLPGVTNSTGRTSFNGAFAQWALGGPFNARAIVSGGKYERSDRRWITTYVQGMTDPAIAEQRYSASEPGFAIGLSAAVPVWRYLSIGVETRTHFLLGEVGGRIGTLDATVRLRP